MKRSTELCQSKRICRCSIEDKINVAIGFEDLANLFTHAKRPLVFSIGGGGTSIPYFLASRVNRPVSAENEYARILLEQGVVGLLLWLGFGVWFVTNRTTFVKDEWFTGRRMGWYLCAITLLSSSLGLGMLTSIPNSFLFLLTLGWVAVKPQKEAQPAFAMVRTPTGMPVVREVRV